MDIQRIQPDVVAFDDVSLAGIRGVLIDLDGTLYDYEPCHQHALAAAFALHSFGLARDAFFNSYRIARDRVTSRLNGQGAGRSRLFAFQIMGEEAGISMPFIAAYALDRAYWGAFIDFMKVDDGAMRFLKRCHDTSVPVCVVTDMTAHIQIEKLMRLGVEGLITRLVTSEEVGVEKPDVRMFEAGLQKLGVRADEAIMFGDDLRKDIGGALAAGLQAGLIRLGDA
ncbi:HAD family hydrolase [Pseudochelatococcus sp. G4_1912]|uniref:HAD family hydrolase n=1 Tax=Pseudochelatococcus sp. G4_1912 TaxID=3114288 RepID=UPI0039C6BC89